MLAAKIDSLVPLNQPEALSLLQAENARLVFELERQRGDNAATCEFAVSALVNVAAARDLQTGLHVRRVQQYVGALAASLKQRPEFARLLTDDKVVLLVRAVPLHDIGKIGIPDRILLKPGSLTPAEFAVMKTHCRIGHDIIDAAARELPPVVGSEAGAGHSAATGGASTEFCYHQLLAVAGELALCHHERWDGAGYPGKLAGAAIPFSARLVAVADAYDALTSTRVYRSPCSAEEAEGIILSNSGTHFDPEVVDAFLEVRAELARIAAGSADELPTRAGQVPALSWGNPGRHGSDDLRTRVAVVEEHTLLRQGLQRFLEENHRISVVGETRTVTELFAKLPKSGCDVVLLGVSTPGRSGLEPWRG